MHLLFQMSKTGETINAAFISDQPDAVFKVFGVGRRETIEKLTACYPAVITSENFDEIAQLPHMNMTNRIVKQGIGFFMRMVVLTSIGAGLSCVAADETAPSPCGKSFIVSGNIQHFKTKPDVKVAEAKKPEMYDEEIAGRFFTASVTGLPEGRYTVEIYLAETYATQPGKRVMDISAGNQKLAENLDLFAKAGFAKEYIVTATVTHAEDPINGPLAISFEGKQGEAKVNAIEVKDAQGKGVACVLAKDLVTLEDAKASVIPDIKEPAIYLNPDQPRGQRVADLVRRMSLKEKVSQIVDSAPPIERLKVPGYNYWNECLHGVARAGNATVFPQAIALAAMWDPVLLRKVADTIATEGRAKNNGARANSPNTARYYGLTFWTPNINIFRDPRWGRGQETYGEDPYLTSQLGVAFIEGLQGDDPVYTKAMACAKHYAVHSGPEKLRHVFNVDPSPRDLYETYLPQFEAAVREGKVGAVMSAYNAVYGVPAPASTFLLTDLLRKQWGFDGHVVSDCGAVGDVASNHRYVKTKEEAAATSLKAGTDIECGSTYSALVGAVNQKLLTVEDIDTALKRVLDARFRLGLFDPPERCKYLNIPSTENDTPAHGEVALEAARRSIVLLKNNGVLPLDKTKLKRIALIGPNADSVNALLGNYHGAPSHPVPLRAGLIAEAGSDIEVTYVPGCPIAAKAGETLNTGTTEFQDAVKAAQSADVVIFAGGINAGMESEEMKTIYEGFDRGDRIRIELPPIQSELLRALQATGKPVVLVNFSGSAIAMPWEAENLSAIVQAWYPGQNGGRAIADVLFGNYNPAGRLPVTFYKSTDDLPDFKDYAMANRTYRYFNGKVLYPFGYGLSYTSFSYGKPHISGSILALDGKITVVADVKNEGARNGAEVVQVYVKHLDAKVPQPIHSLAAFRRVELASGQTAKVDLEIPAKAWRYWDAAANAYAVPEGPVEIQIGSSSQDIRGAVRLQIHR